MRLFRHALALAVVGAGLAAVPTTAAQGDQETPQNGSSIERMREQADGRVAISKDRATAKVTFARVSRGGDLAPDDTRGKSDPVAKAERYVEANASVFGATASQLVRDGISRNASGTVVTFVQEYRGIPVFGAALKAHLDKDGDLTSVNGEAVPVSDLSTDPRLSAAEAGTAALRTVRATPPTSEDGRPADLTGIRAAETTLVVYRHGLVRGVEGPTELAYQVEVTNGANIRDMVFISAETGKPVNRYSMVHEALYRELYEANKRRQLVLRWREGQRLTGLNDDQEAMVRSTGESYWLFNNAFGRDSYDGAGAKMRIVNNDPAISCPNANWNGVTTNYCDGVSSDDIVAHEWGHAYTEHMNGLIYQWQSGALNEAYSDIWGETVDLVNAREDEDEGDIDAARTVGACSTHTGAVPLLSITAPAEIAKDCVTGGAAFGPQLDAQGVRGPVAAAVDADEDGEGTAATTLDGCSPYTNAAEVAGKIALVNRGYCPFVQKAQVAQAAGAAALIIGNNDDAAIGMAGADETLTIPTVSIGRADREIIREGLTTGPVEVWMRDGGGTREDSYRWLIGEDSTAFGGAIRDMWNPTCYGDPGKVSDVQYKCGTDDAGGVHSNSGVPNHGYALLVDGGTYNGVTVEPIGLTKASAIYFDAAELLTPASNFVDHADSLEAACTALVGDQLMEITTDAASPRESDEVISAGDCGQVSAMIAAVELRLDPTEQCDFAPLLDKNTPNLCGEGTQTDVVFSEDFEDGLAGWALDGTSVYGGELFPWAADADGKATNGTGVAFGPAPDAGQCSATTTDISGVNTMTSGDIVVGGAEGLSPRMSFDHYVATEAGYDGGNVQISVNGGDFAPVPAAAYTFNAPGTLITAEAGNTNPLAGQPGFSGTDGGELSGSWGTSQIDLAEAGVQPGDTIQVRFAIGRDGCGGLEGWYVDNVTVALCEVVAGATGRQEGTARRDA